MLASQQALKMAEYESLEAIAGSDELLGYGVAPPFKKPCRATATWVGSLASQSLPLRQYQQPAMLQQQLVPPGSFQQAVGVANQSQAPLGWFPESAYLGHTVWQAPSPAANGGAPAAEEACRQDSLPLSISSPDWLAELGFLDESLGGEGWAGADQGGAGEGLAAGAAGERSPAGGPAAASPGGSAEALAGCGTSCSCQDCELLAQVRLEWQGSEGGSGLGTGAGAVPNLRSGSETTSAPGSSSSAGLGLDSAGWEGDSWRFGWGGDDSSGRRDASKDGQAGPDLFSSPLPEAGQGSAVCLERAASGSQSGRAAGDGLQRGLRTQAGKRPERSTRSAGTGEASGKRSAPSWKSMDEEKSASPSSSAGEQSGSALTVPVGLPFFQRDDSLARRLAEAVGEAYTPLPAPQSSAPPKEVSEARPAQGSKGKRGHGYGAPSQALVVAHNEAASETHLGKQLLAFAEAVATDDDNRARFLMKRLTEEADAQGTSMQRVAFYFLEGLWARTSGTGLQRYAIHQLTPAQEVSDSLVEINKQLPFMDFLATISHATFLEAAEGEAHIHILDLGIWHFNHWPTFMRSLVNRPGPPPSLRMTKLQLPPTGFSTYRIPPIDYAEYKQTLVRVAASVGIAFEYQALQANLESLTVNSIHMRPGEALLVYGAMRFHTLSDGSIIRSSPRDSALRTIRALEPKVFLLGEKQVDHNGPFFLSRFAQALDYYSVVFETMDHHMPRSSVPRMLFEKNLLGRDIVNVVACEGLQRVSRCEPLDKWRMRMKDAGFVQRPMKPRVKTLVWESLERFDPNWGVQEDNGALMLTWKGKPLMATSTWRIAC